MLTLEHPHKRLVGLHYLKYTVNESDESLLARWVENPYWQHFCGFETMHHDVQLHSPSLAKWRKRVGAYKLARDFSETIQSLVVPNNGTKE